MLLLRSGALELFFLLIHREKSNIGNSGQGRQPLPARARSKIVIFPHFSIGWEGNKGMSWGTVTGLVSVKALVEENYLDEPVSFLMLHVQNNFCLDISVWRFYCSSSKESL